MSEIKADVMGVHAPQQCIANHEINSIPKSKELQADRFGTAKPISQETVIVMTGRRKRYSTQEKAELIRLLVDSIRYHRTDKSCPLINR